VARPPRRKRRAECSSSSPCSLRPAVGRCQTKARRTTSTHPPRRTMSRLSRAESAAHAIGGGWLRVATAAAEHTHHRARATRQRVPTVMVAMVVTTGPLAEAATTTAIDIFLLPAVPATILPLTQRDIPLAPSAAPPAVPPALVAHTGIRRSSATLLAPSPRGAPRVQTASHHSTRLLPARVVAKPTTASARRARRAPQDQRTRLPPARVPPTASARRAARPARGRPATRYPHAP